MKESLQALEYFFPPAFVASLPEENHLRKLLCEQRSKAKVWRQHINDCLELALRYGLADADLKGRLKKDWETFIAAINELRCAKFMGELFGIDSLHWHPQGQRGRIGEFEVCLSNLDKPIFVEVKTIFPRELERIENQIMDKLHRYAEQVAIPCFLDVTIKDVGNLEDFSGRRFKKFLREELSKMNVGDVESFHKLPDYEDGGTGLHLEVGIFPTSPEATLQNCHIGVIGGEARFLENHVYIRHSLRKAEAQLPEGKQPCLVLLCCSTGFIDEVDMLNALFGTLGIRYPIITNVAASASEPESIRQPDGFYQPWGNKKVSGTGLYRENLTERGIESKLEIYHNNLWARNPLDYSIFKGKGVRQLMVKINEGTYKYKVKELD